MMNMIAQLAARGVKFTALPAYIDPDDDAAANGVALRVFSFDPGVWSSGNPSVVVASGGGGSPLSLAWWGVRQIPLLKFSLSTQSPLGGFTSADQIDALFALASPNPGVCLIARNTRIATFGPA